MNILITGSSGFIGRNLIKFLIDKNISVNILGIDVYENYSKPNNFTFLRKDLTFLTANEIKDYSIDTVIHLAQSPYYRDFPERAKELFNVNIHGTANLLECIRKVNIKRFIFASTGNVYKSQRKLLKETDEIQPSSYYAMSKFCSELLSLQYSKYFEIAILRLFGVYGPDQKGMLIQNIIDKVIKNEKITLAKNIGLEITPIHVLDCVAIIEKIIFSKNLDATNIFNIAGNEITRLNYIVNIISNLLETETITEITDEEPFFFCGDNSKIINYFSFIPQLRINSTIEEIIKNKEVKRNTLPI